MTGYNNTTIFTFSYTRNKVLRSNDSVLVDKFGFEKIWRLVFPNFQAWVLTHSKQGNLGKEYEIFQFQYIHTNVCQKQICLTYIFFWLQAADSVKYCANKKKIYIFFFSEGYRRFFSQNTKK